MDMLLDNTLSLPLPARARAPDAGKMVPDDLAADRWKGEADRRGMRPRGGAGAERAPVLRSELQRYYTYYILYLLYLLYYYRCQHGGRAQARQPWHRTISCYHSVDEPSISPEGFSIRDVSNTGLHP